MARCGPAPATVIRLWPAGAHGEFTGEMPLAGTGSCSIEAVVNDRQVVGRSPSQTTPAMVSGKP